MIAPVKSRNTKKRVHGDLGNIERKRKAPFARKGKAALKK